jgi:hypothetical protein
MHLYILIVGDLHLAPLTIFEVESSVHIGLHIIETEIFPINIYHKPVILCYAISLNSKFKIREISEIKEIREIREGFPYIP